MSKLVIASIGPASSVQDGGRPGAQRYGLVPSGAMDRLALAAANALVGNEPFTATVEVGPFGAKFIARGGAVRVALAGAPRNADIAGRAVASDTSATLADGETLTLGDGLTLIRCGGHFAGGTVLHVARESALLSGDIVQVIPDRGWVGFMYSYPNLIPLPGESVQAIARALEPYAFETLYGAWWGRIVRGDAKGIVKRSAERYVRALAGELPEGA